ncbi:MAG: hypothetical protein CMJ58_22625 [Planctomycetaceae bacterium]|nr:hypothetical protein [Planctomycetaceae bacterium]
MSGPVTLDELKTMAVEIAPEVQARPFYVVDQKACGLPTETAGGFAISHLATNVFELPDWTGPGSVLAIDLQGCNTGQPRRAAAYARAIVVHELAHLVPMPASETLRMIEATPPEVVKANMRREMSIPADHVTTVTKTHGPAFIVRAAHLFIRAVATGYETQAADVLGYRWLTSLQHYLPFIIDDAIRMRFAPFSAVDQLPIPEEVRRLHARDGQRYQAYIKQGSEDAA